MPKIRALLIDDDPFFVQVLTDSILESYPEIEIIDVAKNGIDGINKISKLKPELVFLDIEMPDMNGFEMLSKIDLLDFKIIFTTAHSQYAIKAFRFNALDYLLKPIINEDLAQAINRFKSIQIVDQSRRIKNAVYNQNTKSPKEHRLILETQNGILQIALKDILYIEGDRNYSIIYKTDGSKELSSKTLGYFEDILTDNGFIRPHRSFLINSVCIVDLKGDSFVLNNQSQIPISRRKKSESKKWFLGQA